MESNWINQYRHCIINSILVQVLCNKIYLWLSTYISVMTEIWYNNFRLNYIVQNIRSRRNYIKKIEQKSLLFELEKFCEGFDKIVLSATLKNQSYFSFCALVHSHHCISIVKLTCFLPVREKRKKSRSFMNIFKI